MQYSPPLAGNRACHCEVAKAAEAISERGIDTQ